MPDLTAKRTLVKSPPELWEELSEAERLAKHLGAFGDITITKLEPEHTVAWEGERARGTVSIEPSGWGTKVTLRAELPEPEQTEVEAERAPTAAVEPPAASEPGDEAQHVDDQIWRFRVDLDAEPEPDVEPEADSGADASEPAPRRGFWGWLFRRRTEGGAREAEAEPVAAEPEAEPVAPEPEAEPIEPDAVAVAGDPLATDPEPLPAKPEPDPAAEEPALGPERVRLILDEALDALGAAHHRPFSRA